MKKRFEQWAGSAGKGPDDRGTAAARQDCPLWKKVKPGGGKPLTPEEAATAIQHAAEILQEITLHDNESVYEEGNKWLNTYFPS